MSSRPAGWGGKEHSNMTQFLDFMSDDVLFGGDALDHATLAAVCSADPSSSANPNTSHQNVMHTLHKEEEGGLAATGRKPSADESCDDESSEEEDSKQKDEAGSGEKHRSKKRKKELSQAAKNKACREKARREKMNERFVELAKLVEPGKEPKTDKSSILCDALKCVQQLRVENHQLKQLNKFLEERVAQHEKDKGQLMYQQSLVMQNNLLHSHAQSQSQTQAQLLNNLSTAALQQNAAMQQSALHQSALHQSALQHSALQQSALQQSALQQSTLQQNAGLVQGQTCVTGVPCGPGTLASLGNPVLANPAFNMNNVNNAAALQAQQQVMIPATTATLQASINLGHKPVLMNPFQPSAPSLQNPYSWITPAMLDSNQDSLLRPPAA